MRENWPRPLLVGEDFNVIQYIHEKNSGGRITRNMRDFEEFVRSSNLRDIPLSNAKYTWTNGQDYPILNKLDKFLTSSDWEEFYRNIYQEVLPRLTYDHWLVLLNTLVESYGPKPFKFENMWMTHPFFKEMVHI